MADFVDIVPAPADEPQEKLKTMSLKEFLNRFDIIWQSDSLLRTISRFGRLSAS